MNHKYAGSVWPVRLMKLGLWALRAAYVQIPDASPAVSIDPALSRTPHWLAEGNPYADHPWAGDPEARLPEHVRVVVVGAGFGGACVAYHWSRQGSGPLIVLDKDAPAQGAAGRNAGFLTAAGGSYHGYYIYEPVRAYAASVRPDLSADALDAIALGYADAYLRALDVSVAAIHETIEREGIDCDVVRRGCVILSDADDAARVQKALDVGAFLGWPDWSRLDADEVRELTGIVGDAFGALQGGTSTWHPAKWVWGILRAALKSDHVSLYSGTEVTAVVRDGDRFRVSTTRGTLYADQVVNATEASTAGIFQDFLPNRDADLLRAHKSQAMFAVGGSEQMHPGRAVCLPLAWFHPQDSSMVLGSDNHRVPLSQASWNDPSRFVTLHTASEAVRSWPDARLRIVREWTGTVGQAPDKAPVVGEMAVPGSYMLGGFAGAGSAISFGAGLEVVRRVCGEGTGDTHWPTDLFGIERFADPRRYGERFLHEGSDPQASTRRPVG
jgi:glycine/D-amino acid oxidase-like deaminating enzyme